jgi:lipopolysaccharide cholinephosphotransferase
MENEKPYGMGVFIDIYPYDGLGNTKKEAISYGLKGDRLSSLCYQSSRDHFAVETTKSPLRKLLKYPVYLVAKLLGKDFFQEQLEKLARVKDYDTSEYVGCVIWLSWGEKDIFPRKWFDETIMMPFGKYRFRVPKYYVEVLRHEYGDYMQLPPEEERVGHHFYKVYEK